MPLNREERKLLHQKSKQPTFGNGKPDSNQGNEGDIAYRQVEGSGLVQYVKQNGSWVAVGSQGDMPDTRDVTRTVSSGSGGVGSHSHGEFIKKDGSVSYTGNQSFGDNNITNVGNLDVDGTTTLDQTTVSTDDGVFEVNGTNNINLNTAGTLDIDSRIKEVDVVAGYTINTGSTYALTSSGDIDLKCQGTTSSANNLSAIGGKSDFTKHGNVIIQSYNKTTESGTSSSNHGANGVHILADAGNATTKHNNIFIEQKNTPEKANGYGVDIKSSNGVRIRTTNNSAPSPPEGQQTEIKMFSTGQFTMQAGASTEPTSDSNANRVWIKGACELETLYKGSGGVINCSTHDVTFDQLDTQKLMRNYTYIVKDDDVPEGSGDSNKVDIVSSAILSNEGVGTVYQVTVGIDVGDGVHLRQGCLSVLCSRLASTTWFVTILGSNTNNISGVGAVTASNTTGMRWHNTDTGYDSNEIYITAQRIAEASHYP